MVDGEFDNLTVNNVLTIGADTNLYRSAADVLKTDDDILMVSGKRLRIPKGIIGGFRMGDYLHIGHTSFANFPYLAFNCTLTTSSGANHFTPTYAGSATATMGVLRGSAGKAELVYHTYAHGTDDSEQNLSSFTEILRLTDDGQLRIPVTGSNAGLLVGGDANLYRSAANTLKTDDSLDIQSGDNIAQHGLLINTGWINPNDFTEHMPFDVKVRGTRCVYIQTDGALCANKVIESRETWEDLDQQELIDAIDGHAFEDTIGKIKFYDPTKGDDDDHSVFLHGVLVGEPMLVCSQHLTVEKDFIAKGMLDSLEGEVVLNGGNYAPAWSWDGHTTGGVPSTANPFIWLAKGGIFGDYGTLEIRVSAASGNWNWGDFACGTICISGQYPRLDFKDLDGNLKIRLNHDGLHCHLRTYEGDLVLAAQSYDVRPLSNNVYRLGNVDFRWKEIWAVSTHFGDAVFANGWRLTEDPEDGVLLVRPDGSIAQKWK